jgi:outer membrane immunogenic protein
MRYLYVAALAASAMATPAFAQDNGGTTGKFDGFHLEALGGVDYSGANAVVRDNSSPNPVVASGVHSTGAMFGASAGFDFRAGGNLVFGVEGEVTRATSEYCNRLDTTTSNATGAVTTLAVSSGSCLRTGPDYYAGARVGIVVAPAAMLYIKGGYSKAKGIVNVHYALSPTAVSTTQVDQPGRTSLDGFRVGGGIEFNATGAVLVKLEYRYARYQQHFDRHQLLMGLGIRL